MLLKQSAKIKRLIIKKNSHHSHKAISIPKVIPIKIYI